MLVNREEVIRYIPQREPIVVVHGLVAHSANASTSVFNVEQDHLFVRDGFLLPSGIMENIAQTAALRSGYQFSLSISDEDGELPEPPIGFIGALKNFKVHRLPSVGDRLQTTVTIMHEVMGMQVVEGKVSVDEENFAECEMKIFLNQAPQE